MNLFEHDSWVRTWVGCVHELGAYMGSRKEQVLFQNPRTGNWQMSKNLKINTWHPIFKLFWNASKIMMSGKDCMMEKSPGKTLALAVDGYHWNKTVLSRIDKHLLTAVSVSGGFIFCPALIGLETSSEPIGSHYATEGTKLALQWLNLTHLKRQNWDCPLVCFHFTFAFLVQTGSLHSLALHALSCFYYRTYLS